MLRIIRDDKKELVIVIADKRSEISTPLMGQADLVIINNVVIKDIL